ncbi:MAG TPA: hypothetical protein VM925_31670 [Labilithrix sp.]|nr:hypothetical protein [Labilithrix sp.]
MRIREDHWTSGGADRLSRHYFNGTIVRSYQGDWKPSDKIAFVYELDYPTAGDANADVGKLLFVATNAHADTEILLQTGESFTCALRRP